MINQDDFNIVDPKLKDKEWALRMLIYLNYNQVSLVAGKNVRELRSWQYSTYDTCDFRQPYLHLLPKSLGGDIETEEEAKKKLKIDFTPLGLFEVTKNVIGGEINKEAIHIDADCFDPTIQAKKEREFDLLKNKKVIQKQVNSLYNGLGIKSDFQVGDKNDFESNMNDFEAMGLSPENPEDIQFFSETLYRHRLETVITQMINELNVRNEVHEIQKKQLDDMLVLKRFAMQTYYNTSTGLPSVDYVYPEECNYNGAVKSNNCKDAVALGWTRIMSISDFMKIIGDKDMTNDDYSEMLLNSNVTSVFPDANSYAHGLDFTCQFPAPPGYMSLQDFYRLNVSVGYKEWKTTDKNEIGRFVQKTMKAYFLNTISQLPYKLFKFGYLNMQVREGIQSEYSYFSITMYKLDGLSMAEVALPYWRRIFRNWLKYQYFMESAKPPGYAYDIASLRRVAKEIIGKSGNMNAVIEMMEMFRKTPDMFYSLGDEDDEKIIGGSGIPYQEKKNGVSDTAIQFLTSIDWCFAKIKEQIGFNDARAAQSPSPEEAYKKTQLVFNQSENATEYINSSLVSIYSDMGYRVFYIIQGIISFDLFGKDILEQIFGEYYVFIVKYMDKIPSENFGIRIHRFLRDREREEIRTITNMAVAKGEISEEIAFIINDIDDYKKAATVISYYKERVRKQKAQEQMQIEQAKQSTFALQHKFKMEEIQAEGQILLQKQQLVEQGLLAQTKMLIDGKMMVQDQRLAQTPALNEQKSELRKGEETHKQGLEVTKDIIADAPENEK